MLDPGDEHLRGSCSMSGTGYVDVFFAGRSWRLHRLICYAQDGLQVDHINGDRMDNRRGNLRMVTGLTNCHNIGDKLRRDNSTGYLGVYPNKEGRFVAAIECARKRYIIGQYATPQEANTARLLKEKELWGIQPRRLTAFIEAGIDVADAA